ncbi:MAG: choice-of-anchor tandem repeat GloVer-containing protein [Terriglobales bacterium]
MKTLSILMMTLLLTAGGAASTFKVFYTFDFSDGSNPNGGLIRDSAGNFYGTTQFGGKSNRGVVFKLDSGGQQTILYTFTGASDGGIPIGRLLSDAQGNLYGITALGGDPTCSCGTVFKLLAKNGSLKVLHSFKGGKDGSQNQGQPELGLVMVGSDLYGSASFGGVSGCDGNLGCGVIFKVTQSGKETVLYRFTGKADGAFPQDLTVDKTGNIYGATGGSYMQGNGGTLFKIDTTGKLTTLYTFRGSANGVSPRWHLLRSASGVFHGVTQFGGNTTNCAISSVGCGVVFSVNPAAKEHVLHTFGKASGGEEPSGGLLNVAGNFYGVTVYGGTVNSACTFGCGVVYGVTSSGKYSVLYRFTGAADGGLPSGSLTEDADGNLYGATDAGGSGNNGVIYKITP